ncbi:hypothetical protein K7G98_03215 [Saccharothrix sp. MB29]|nr:hypothetical protein [Saccharothrix sp. MB29]
MNKAIAQAVREGGSWRTTRSEREVKPRTYRPPDQPEVRMRQLGPRSFGGCPGASGALLDHVAEQDGNTGGKPCSAVLEMLGLKRLTDNVKNRFAAVQVLRA